MKTILDAALIFLIGIGLILAVVTGISAKTEADRERAHMRICMAKLDTPESRCVAAPNTHCIPNAAEFERYQIQRLNQERICNAAN